MKMFVYDAWAMIDDPRGESPLTGEGELKHWSYEFVTLLGAKAYLNQPFTQDCRTYRSFHPNELMELMRRYLDEGI